MSNVRLVIGREYKTRVKKKSFIIMTFLAPLLFAGIFLLIFWLASSNETKEIEILDKSGLFTKTFVTNEEHRYVYIDTPLDSAKKHVENEAIDGLVYIPELNNLDMPEGIAFYSPGNPSIKLIGDLEIRIRHEIEDIKLIQSGLTQEILNSLKSSVSIHSINLAPSGEEKDSNSNAASAIGYIAGFIIYMFVFIYGAQCMRGVIEEKTSRIVEVLISSIRPFHLMMGKVIGIAAVGLTQIAMWIVLTGALWYAGVSIFVPYQENSKQAVEILRQDDQSTQPSVQETSSFEDFQNAMSSINIPLTLIYFVFYFLGGYLLYSALFAAVGSAVDSDADAQQFMLPITIPLTASIASLPGVILEPNGAFAFWMSMIPFTSPVIMMVRVPFEVPVWELISSMALLVSGFIFTIWIASRVYRVGILMHGTKVNFKILVKWFIMKN